MIEIGLALGVGLLLFRGGIIKGRYSARKKMLLLSHICLCAHASNFHALGGKGACQWEDETRKYECLCNRFTPDIDEVEE